MGPVVARCYLLSLVSCLLLACLPARQSAAQQLQLGCNGRALHTRVSAPFVRHCCAIPVPLLHNRGLKLVEKGGKRSEKKEEKKKKKKSCHFVAAEMISQMDSELPSFGLPFGSTLQPADPLCVWPWSQTRHCGGRLCVSQTVSSNSAKWTSRLANAKWEPQ